MSEQTTFLEKAVEADIDSAVAAYPNVLAESEEELLRQMSKDQLSKLLELRRAAESGEGINAIHGSGVLSM